MTYPENVRDDLQDFWNVLEHQLKVKPTPDGMEDVFITYRHLTDFIDEDAEEDEDHREMLARALAIRRGA